MAFKMNRPIIKGTKIHKQTIAKAKEESIVNPYSSHASDVLSNVSEYSRSNVPHSIDYGLDIPDIKLKKKKKKKTTEEKEEKEVMKGCMDSKATNYNAEATESDDSCIYEKKDIKVDPDDPDKLEQEYYSDMLDAENGGTETSGKPSDYSKSKGYKTFVRKQEEQYIREAEELKRRQAEASKARQSKITPIKPKTDLQQIPTSTKEDIQKPSKPPKSKGKLDADKNPKYQVGKEIRDAEGQITQLAGNVQSPGYNYDVNNDLWTYNGIPIRESEVSSEAYSAIMPQVMESQEKYAPEPLSQNTLIQETTPKIVTPSTTKEQDWKERSRTKRLDKLWADSKEGGTVRKNMIKDGYIPLSER